MVKSRSRSTHWRLVSPEYTYPRCEKHSGADSPKHEDEHKTPPSADEIEPEKLHQRSAEDQEKARSQNKNKDRITSYNVCYTKLLRARLGLQPWPQGLVQAQGDIGILGGIGRRLFQLNLVEFELLDPLAGDLLEGGGLVVQVLGGQIVRYFSPESDFDFNVVIRSILYNKERNYVSYSVGSAITAKSDPLKEYEECLVKAKAMRERNNFV